MENEQRILPATNLPEGWVWRFYDDGSGGLYSPEGKNIVGVDFITSEYEIEGKWHFISGYPYETVSRSDFMDSMEESVRNNLERDSKKSVIKQIRAAEKGPKQPQKDKPSREKSEPEH